MSLARSIELARARRRLREEGAPAWKRVLVSDATVARQMRQDGVPFWRRFLRLLAMKL